jgi:hypothetical protein
MSASTRTYRLGWPSLCILPRPALLCRPKAKSLTHDSRAPLVALSYAAALSIEGSLVSGMSGPFWSVPPATNDPSGVIRKRLTSLFSLFRV